MDPKVRTVARRAAWERVGPLLLGPIFGIPAFFCGPSDGDSDFFAAAAQVVPVLLLALAVEARVLSLGLRWTDDRVSNALELTRLALTGATVAGLGVACLLSLSALEDSGASSEFVFGAVAWAVGAITGYALLGLGSRPRVTLRLVWRQTPGPPNTGILRVGMGNRFGERDIEPILTVLIPKGLSIARCDQDGQALPVTTPPIFLETPEAIEGDSGPWIYPTKRVLLSAGDSTLAFFRIGGMTPDKRYRVHARLDHIDLPGREGRLHESIWIQAKTEPSQGDLSFD